MLTIYVCDGRPEYRTLLRSVLTLERGLQIVGESGDVASCVQHAPSLGPDVTLLDADLPGGGLEALWQVRAVLRSSDIVVLTTSAAADYARLPGARLASGFIRKPVNILDLPDLIYETVRIQVRDQLAIGWPAGGFSPRLPQ